MFLVFWKKKSDFNWVRILIDSVVDIAMLACFWVAIKSLVSGTSPLSLDVLRVTTFVAFGLTATVTVRNFGNLTREHWIDLTGAFAAFGAVWYFARSAPYVIDDLRLAVSLNGLLVLFVWGKVVLHKLRRASDTPRGRVRPPLIPDAIHTPADTGYKGPGTPGGPGEEMPREHKFGGRAPHAEPAGAGD